MNFGVGASGGPCGTYLVQGLCVELLGVGNSAYATRVSYTPIGTVPPEAQFLAIGVWAGEREDHDLVTNPLNFDLKMISTSSCTRSNAPWTSSVEGQCTTFSTSASFAFIATGISECKLQYSATSRVVSFTDTSTSEDCAYAVYTAGAGMCAIPL